MGSDLGHADRARCRFPEALAEHWVRDSAYTVDTTQVVRSDTLTLATDGEVRTGGSSVTTFTGWAPAYRLRTHATTWSSADDPHVDADGQVVVDRYRFLDDGLTLEVSRGDGTVSRRLAYALGERFVLDGRSYRVDERADRASIAERFCPGGFARADWLSALGDARAEERKDEEERKRRSAIASLPPLSSRPGEAS